MPGVSDMTDAQLAARWRTIADLHAWGIFLIRQRLHREHPDASKEELGSLLEAYLINANQPHDPTVFKRVTPRVQQP